MRTRSSKRAALYRLLKDRRWHRMSELLRVGGYRYGGRLFELRHGVGVDKPVAIQTKEDRQSGCWRYRMVTP